MDRDEQWSRLEHQPETAITALATAQISDKSVIIFAASSGGIHHSLDHGHTWSTLTGTSSIPLITAIAPSPNHSNDHSIFIGTSNGCYRRVDDEAACQLVLGDIQVLAAAVVPDVEPTRETQKAGSDVIFLGTESDGILRSRDGGTSWEAANAGLLDLSVLAFTFSPTFFQDRIGFAATASGLYRTRNGGKAWRLIDMPGDEIAVQSLAISPSFASDGLLFAGTEERGLYLSADAGSTWVHVEDLAAESINAVATSPGGKLIVVGTEQGAAVTLDGGVTWRWDGGKLGPVLSTCLLSLPDRNIVVSGLLANGIAISTNQGLDWTQAPGSIK